MSYVRWGAWRRGGRLRRGVARVRELLRSRPRLLGSRWAPRVQAVETESGYVVRAEVPGLDPRDLEISVWERTLRIAGEKKVESTTRDGRVYHSERRAGCFRRELTLPRDADLDRISAECVHGVLTVRVAKRPGAMARRVAVEDGGRGMS